MNGLRICAAMVAMFASTGIVEAHDWRHARKGEAIIVTEQYQRTETRLHFVQPRANHSECQTYKHAIWIDGRAIVTDREACKWPDGTIRHGRRPY